MSKRLRVFDVVIVEDKVALVELHDWFFDESFGKICLLVRELKFGAKELPLFDEFNAIPGDALDLGWEIELDVKGESPAESNCAGPFGVWMICTMGAGPAEDVLPVLAIEQIVLDPEVA